MLFAKNRKNSDDYIAKKKKKARTVSSFVFAQKLLGGNSEGTKGEKERN